MKRISLVKLLKPNWTFYIVKIILSVFIFAFAFLLVLGADLDYIDEGDMESLLGVSIVSVLIIGLLLLAAVSSLKKQKKILKKRGKILEELDNYSEEKIQEQIDSAEFYFKTFYLLDEHLFVPKAKLFLKYSDIYKYKTVYHYTNRIPDGIYVEISDNDNLKYRFSVKKWKDYKNNFNEFMTLLESKGLFSGENAAENESLSKLLGG